MRKVIGVAAVVLGAVLILSGLDAVDSLGSRLSRLFTGSPTDRSIWLLLAGTVAVMGGVSLMYFRRGQRAPF